MAFTTKGAHNRATVRIVPGKTVNHGRLQVNASNKLTAIASI
jgi:hypothetical protein